MNSTEPPISSASYLAKSIRTSKIDSDHPRQTITMSNNLANLFASLQLPSTDASANNASTSAHDVEDVTAALQATKLAAPDDSQVSMLQKRLEEAWAEPKVNPERYETLVLDFPRTNPYERNVIADHVMQKFEWIVSLAGESLGYDDPQKFVADTFTHYGYDDAEFGYRDHLLDGKLLKLSLLAMRILINLWDRVRTSSTNKDPFRNVVHLSYVDRVDRWISRLKMAIWHGQCDPELDMI